MNDINTLIVQFQKLLARLDPIIGAGTPISTNAQGAVGQLYIDRTANPAATWIKEAGGWRKVSAGGVT